MTDPIRVIKNTEYQKLISDQKTGLNVGITHHSKGLGKLKVSQDSVEYGVPIVDIQKPMAEWRIDKKV
jgi:hypothetical protein